MTFSSQHHTFDISLAAEYGVECAILIHHFQHWIRINRASKRNVKEGRCWTYQSRKDIQAHFPYWNYDKVKYLCEKLEQMGVLITNNFNKISIDKTLWYAFVDEKRFGLDEESSNNLYERQNCPSMGKSAQREGKSAQPIPDTIPNTKTQIREEHPPTPPPRGDPKGGERVGYGSHVKLKKEDYENFCKEYGQKDVDNLIEEMNEWIGSGRGSEYKDYNAGIKTWIRRRKWQKGQESEEGVNAIHNNQAVREPTEEEKKWHAKRVAEEENYQWVENLLFQKENRPYLNNLRFTLLCKWCEVPEVPESKVYYDSPGFKVRINSLLEKLKTIDYTSQHGAIAC
jgi:hypothetical protein